MESEKLGKKVSNCSFSLEMLCHIVHVKLFLLKNLFSTFSLQCSNNNFSSKKFKFSNFYLQGIMLVYDITQEKTFDNIAKWLRNIDEVR